MPSRPPCLGAYLLAQGWLHPAEHTAAVALQAQTHERFGAILLAHGWITRRQLARALAAIWDLAYVEVADCPFPNAAAPWTLAQAIEHHAVIWRVREAYLFVAVTDRPSPALYMALADTFPGATWEFAVTPPWDFQRFLRHHYGEALQTAATTTLLRRHPEESAARVLTFPQQMGAIGFLGLVLAGLITHGTTTLALLNLGLTSVFAAAVCFKWLLAVIGGVPQGDAAPPPVPPAALPLYTLLIPVYQEAPLIPQLLEAIAALDYPPEKLEVLLLIESDDAATWTAAMAAQPPAYVHLIQVPPGQPRTKPRACNVGLHLAHGEYLVIYDAEDRPDPDQLLKAAAAFAQAPPDVICLQAALNYYNQSSNRLTRLFTLEYSYWFDQMLPGLQRLGMPIPLGGTSNHFRTAALRALDGWDPYNVAEDADLGVRAAARGYRVAVLPSTTWEEATAHVPNWLRQRSRWLKGYLQTFLVHNRTPGALIRRVGWRSALGTWLLIGGTPLGSLAYLPSALCFGDWLATHNPALAALFPPPVLAIGLWNLLVGTALGIYLSMLAVWRRRQYALTGDSLLTPIYWMLHSLAAYKGLVQLITRPFYWEKTRHGLSPSRWTSARTVSQ